MRATLEHEPAGDCPGCGTPGVIALSQCTDFVYGLDGRWTFRRCPRCNSLWLDPRLARAALPLLYTAEYYTHTPPESALQAPPGAGMRAVFSIKLGVVEGAFGYPGLCARAPAPALAHAARRFARVPLLAAWAGHYVRFLPHRAGGRLLDVGSGNGTFLQRMRALGWDVRGIEPDARAAALAVKHGLDVVHSPLEDVRLAPATYDAITLHHVFEHFADPVAVLQALAAALRPGGLLVSISPNPESTLARWFGKHWRGLEPPRHPFLPSRAGYAGLLGLAGLQPVRTWTSTRTTSWMCYQSLAVRRTGHIAEYKPRLGPEALATLVHVLAFAGHTGEEVICVARK